MWQRTILFAGVAMDSISTSKDGNHLRSHIAQIRSALKTEHRMSIIRMEDDSFHSRHTSIDERDNTIEGVEPPSPHGTPK